MNNPLLKAENVCSEPDFSFLLHYSKGGKTRKRILKNLLNGSRSCNRIATDLGLNWRTAYRHLRILEKKRLVNRFDFGVRKFYKLTLKGERVTKIFLNARQL